MAKESTSSRIPRLDGVSRIPLPGSIRPSHPTSWRSQILRPPTSFGNYYNTNNFSGLKPSKLSGNSLKKSASGDRLSNAVNLMSKKTTTALSKFFGKPENFSNELQSSSLEQHDEKTKFVNGNKTVSITASTPRPLTRSDTFVRGDSQIDMLGITHDVLVQSTPSPANADKRSALYTTQSLDATHISVPIAQLGETFKSGTHTSKIGFTNTFDLTSPVTGTQMMGHTMCINSHKTNLANNLNDPIHALGATMCVNSPTEHLQKQMGSIMGSNTPNLTQTLNSSQLIDNLINGDLTQTIKSGIRIIDNSGIASPATNATYSNPGSTDNLQMLDDVSIPSECEAECTLQPERVAETKTYNKFLELKADNMDNTLQVQAPDKTNMKLPLNSTMNTECLLDLTSNMLSPASHMQMFNLYMEVSPGAHPKNTSQLLYMTQMSSSVATTPDRNHKFGATTLNYQHTPVPSHVLSPMLLKGAQSEMVLPTRTPDEYIMGEPMDLDNTITGSEQKHAAQGVAMSLQDVNNPNPKHKSRFSFGLDLTESTLDCSIELVDVSLSSTVLSQPNGNSMNGNNMSQSPSTNLNHQQQQQLLKKQNSFEMDESLGILTPDQMKEFLDSTNTNTNNLELPLVLNTSCGNNNKLSLHQMRIDQTPSPEELPLDPVGVKTDISDVVFTQQQQHQAAFCAAQQRQNMQRQNLQSSSISTEPVSQHTDTELSNKTDQMTKSSVSKISTSFITSVTSVTSLDTGYQGDGEMSRPASRGAGDHSPSNGPAARKGGGSHVSRQPIFHQQQQQMPPIRRQDPMTDSDFFTESDADDIFHRGDRRAQVVIDGQLYGPSMMQSTASAVFISEDPQMEDSCMESSGIFTDVENRCDEDLAQMRQRQDANAVEPLSPDADGGDDSTETVKSIRECGKYKKVLTTSSVAHESETVVDAAALGQGQLSCSQTSSTIQSSLSTDRLSVATTLSNRTSYCSVDGSAVNVDGKSFSSLEESFDECNSHSAGREHTFNALSTNGGKSTKSSTTGNTTEQPKLKAKQLLSSSSVQRVSSPRKHASLTSLCYVKNSNNNVCGAGAKTETRSESGSKASLSDSVKSANATGKYSSPRAKSTLRSQPKLTPATRTNVSASSPPLIVRKSHSPNKWDAVMNKIASNKTLIKKNYSDVKSKVSTRVNVTVVASPSAASGHSPGGGSASSPTVRRGSPASVSSGPTSPSVAKVLLNARSSTVAAASTSPQPTDTGLSGLQSPQTKRLLQATIKRGRSYSKDSQKSSQSDLSLTSGLGSPKLLAKTPLRAGKKRDVRNLSISPTDLGPPPKTQQTANGISTRPKTTAGVTIAHKRFPVSVCPSPSATSTTASPTSNNGTASIKGSPPVKKLTISAKRLDVKACPAKTPLKDHNRIIGSPLAIPSTTKHVSGSKLESPTELHEIGNGIVHHNNNNITTTNTTEKSASANNTRTSSQTSASSSPTPTLVGQHGKKIAAATAAVLLDKKSQSKLQTSRKLLFQKQQQHQLQQQQRSTEEAPATPAAECLDAAELQQLKLLNRHSCNGRLDYGSLERHLQQTERVKQQQDKGVEALGVLLQYLVYDMDAFACPAAKSETVKAKENLTKALHLLDEAKSSCAELQEQLFDKEAYYARREEELQTMHRCELEKVTVKLDEFQMVAGEQQCEFNRKLAEKDVEIKRALDSYRLEMDNKFSQKQQQLLAAEDRERALQARLDAAERAELEILDRLTSSERKYETRIKERSGRERELCDHVKMLTRELEKIRELAADRERELKDKLNLSHDEISVLRTSRKSFNESLERGTSPRNSSNASAASLEITRLQSEAESLRCVLELKQKEISKLTKHNEELVRDADERIALQGKISLLEARNEMLQSELEIKSDKEKEFFRQIDDSQKACNHEKVMRTRLSYDNEALQWQLKQRSEQLHIVEAKLQELSGHDSLNHTSSTQGSLNRSALLNGSSYAHSSMNNMDDVSPPASPLIKGVIEKTDSVSWVLEMDDETPEAAASKMVKRAGSFRSVERSPSTRRQLSLSASAATNSLGASVASPANSGPSPLSQSMSATSVIRQHSSESVAELASRSHVRIRSKSVSIKGGEEIAAASTTKCGASNSKKIARQHSSSGGSTRKHELMPGSWKEPMSSSSPYGMRPRSSTKISADGDAAQVETSSSSLFRRPSSSSATARKLITCDTSTLNSGERLEQRSLPSHPSVHNLKTLKKCQAVQESAGEAMVSGTNSEDESCSASSDEIACSTSTSSATSGSTSSLNQIKNSHMSLEEALLLDKINSLNGTPMEVSWSDDAGEAFTSNGAAV